MAAATFMLPYDTIGRRLDVFDDEGGIMQGKSLGNEILDGIGDGNDVKQLEMSLIKNAEEGAGW